jgi:hypothetical protein
MNYRERYLVPWKDRLEAEGWVTPTASRFGLLYYHQQNVMRVEASPNLFVTPGDGSGKSPVTESYVLSFHFSKLFPAEPAYYLRRVEFEIGSFFRAEWFASESAGDPPNSLADLLASVSAEVKAPVLVFADMYEGIYSRLFPFVEHEDVHTDVSGEDY